MNEVTEYANSKIEFYDDWLNFRTNVFAKKLKNKHTLKKFISVEKLVLKAIKDVSIAHAFGKARILF